MTDAAGNEFTTTTDANGEYFVEGDITNPLLAGEATVAGVVNGVTVTNTVNVVGSAVVERDLQAAPIGPLAFTGRSFGQIVMLGFILFATGGMFLLLGRRRDDEDEALSA